MTNPPLKVAIIGAGPAGCCLARILTQSSISPSLSITIFEGERNLDVRSQGGTLDLRQDTGLAAIRAANLVPEFDRYARYEGESLVICDKRLTKWLVKHGESENKSAHAPEIDRYRLRQLLLDSLPAGIIQWGKRLDQVVVADGAGSSATQKHSLVFRDGTTASGFDLVVGADGTWSRARPTLSSATPSFSGVVGWAFTIPNASSVCPATVTLINGGNVMCPHDRKFLGMQQMGDDVIQVTLFFLPDNDDGNGKKWLEKAPYDTADVDAVRRWVLEEKMADWAPELREPLEKCSGSAGAMVNPWTLFELPVGHSWEHVRGVTLMGDAAHVMTPFSGEGVNQGLTDAKVLGEQIIKAMERCKSQPRVELTTAFDDAVAAYEKEMFGRMAERMENTRRMKEITMKDGGLYKNAERWGLTAVEDGLSARWITRPAFAVLIYGYFFFWRLWNQPKP